MIIILISKKKKIRMRDWARELRDFNCGDFPRRFPAREMSQTSRNYPLRLEQS